MDRNIMEVLANIQRQFEREEKVRLRIEGILAIDGYEEDDLPQNDNLAIPVRHIVRNSKNVYQSLETVELDYIEICGYKCFKVDDNSSGAEDICCISKTEVLVIEG